MHESVFVFVTNSASPLAGTILPHNTPFHYDAEEKQSVSSKAELGAFLEPTTAVASQPWVRLLHHSSDALDGAVRGAFRRNVFCCQGSVKKMSVVLVQGKMIRYVHIPDDVDAIRNLQEHVSSMSSLRVQLQRLEVLSMVSSFGRLRRVCGCSALKSVCSCSSCSGDILRATSIIFHTYSLLLIALWC